MYQEFLERFRREARLIASLEHPNIVTIHDYKEQADIAYLVMPYFPRKSLADLLHQRGSLTLQETLEYMEQAAHALGYAHKRISYTAISNPATSSFMKMGIWF